MQSKYNYTKHLHKWMWKWHFIAGIILMPVILFLIITGTLYLFKKIYEDYSFASMQKVQPSAIVLSYEKQREIVEKHTGKKVSFLIVSKDAHKATAFEIGKWSKKTTVYINQYTGEIQGSIKIKDTLMHKIKKLHGNLLLGYYGEKAVELTASWMVILILTGLYIWWPQKGWKLKGLFLIRRDAGKRVFYRDLHAVSAFWMSIFMLLTLAGGLPWTSVWGEGFKTVQKLTNSGYPKDYSGKKLYSLKENTQKISLDEMVQTAKNLDLKGSVSLSIPKNENSVYTIKNKAQDLYEQKVFHYDQNSQNLIKSFTWDDVGSMMQSRQWLMHFHQGLFGLWNWILMLVVSLLFFLSGIAGIVSYYLRKTKNDFSIPSVPIQFKVGKGIIVILLFLCVFFPLFGASVLLIVIFEFIKKYLFERKK